MSREGTECTMPQETEAQATEPERPSSAYRRDLYRARLVIGKLRDEALASGEPFHVADLTLDAIDLDELWDGLDRVDTHFWKDEEFRRYMERPGGEALLATVLGLGINEERQWESCESP